MIIDDKHTSIILKGVRNVLLASLEDMMETLGEEVLHEELGI